MPNLHNVKETNVHWLAYGNMGCLHKPKCHHQLVKSSRYKCANGATSCWKTLRLVLKLPTFSELQKSTLGETTGSEGGMEGEALGCGGVKQGKSVLDPTCWHGQGWKDQRLAHYTYSTLAWSQMVKVSPYKQREVIREVTVAWFVWCCFKDMF